MLSFSAFPSAVLASTAAIQLSRSAALAAWKVCFWPFHLNKNSFEPSLVTSETSAFCPLAIVLESVVLEDVAYQVDDAGGVCLVLSALGEEEKTLSGLRGPRSGWVSEAELLVLEVSRELFDIDSVIAEPEVTFGEPEAPRFLLVLDIVYVGRGKEGGGMRRHT